jgi:hypothetical protein
VCVRCQGARAAGVGQPHSRLVQAARSGHDRRRSPATPAGTAVRAHAHTADERALAVQRPRRTSTRGLRTLTRCQRRRCAPPAPAGAPASGRLCRRKGARCRLSARRCTRRTTRLRPLPPAAMVAPASKRPGAAAGASWARRGAVVRPGHHHRIVLNLARRRPKKGRGVRKRARRAARAAFRGVRGSSDKHTVRAYCARARRAAARRPPWTSAPHTRTWRRRRRPPSACWPPARPPARGCRLAARRAPFRSACTVAARVTHAAAPVWQRRTQKVYGAVSEVARSSGVTPRAAAVAATAAATAAVAAPPPPCPRAARS